MYYLLIILIVIIWGVGSFAGKLATEYNNPTFVTVCSTGLYFVFSLPLLLLLLKNEGAMGKFDLSLNALWPIIAIGILGLTGEWFYFTALSKGPGVPVISLTALYPVVSMILLFGILGERVSGRQGLGLVLIFAGLVIFLWDKEAAEKSDVDLADLTAAVQPDE